MRTKRFIQSYRTVFFKEFRELLRDRRSLLWLLAPPIILPLIGLGAMLFISTKTIKITSDDFPILIENGDQAPELVQRFETEETVHIVEAPQDPEQDPFGEALFIVSLPQDFQERMARADTASVELVPRDNSIAAFFGKAVVKDIIEDYGNDLMEERLAAQGLSREWLTPIQINESEREPAESAGIIDVVDVEKDSSNIPIALFFLVAMTSWLVGGGMSLILDTTVGEKERQTIETLLVTPASRTGIVMGKMTVVFSSLMAVMGLWLLDVLLLNALSTAGPALVALELLGPGQTLEILVKSSSNALVLVPALLALLIPFAVMLNGMVMAGSAMAANYREASLFLALIQLGLPAVVLLTVFSLPARVGVLVYAVPFFGTVAAIRDLFANTLPALGLLINFISASIYTAGIIGSVTWLFDQEWSTTRGL